jgi:hypothetical protein
MRRNAIKLITCTLTAKPIKNVDFTCLFTQWNGWNQSNAGILDAGDVVDGLRPSSFGDRHSPPLLLRGILSAVRGRSLSHVTEDVVKGTGGEEKN